MNPVDVLHTDKVCVAPIPTSDRHFHFLQLPFVAFSHESSQFFIVLKYLTCSQTRIEMR